MSNKDIKSEARQKLALNMHQAIILYTVEFVIFVTLVALVVLACMCLKTVNTIAGIVMVCYGVLLGLIAVIGFGTINYAMVDFYIASYKCKPYNVRRLGDTLARSGIVKVLLMSVKRTLLSFLLLLCLIAPGVIYIIRTSMANHLLIANPNMKASTALSASNKVMSGKTGAYFSLSMSLLGWKVLGVLTLGLGFIFIAPYLNLVKSVYYKRNLQGDKAVYNIAIQPVSPPVFAPTDAVQGNGAARPVEAEAADRQKPMRAEDLVQEGMAPIDTLDGSDVMEMDMAMRDFGAGGADVPEIPLKPVATSQKNAAQSQPQEVQPAIEPEVTELGDTGIKERTLTTAELEQTDDISSRFNDMYTRSTQNTASGRDYISVTGNQAPNDFVTGELNEDDLLAQFMDDFGTSDDASADGGAAGGTVSDDFAADPFTVDPVTADAFTVEPIATDAAAEEPAPNISMADRIRARAAERASRGDSADALRERAAGARPSNADRAAAGASAQNSDAAMSRAERVRRDYEERLKNLRKQ
ncbi:MAG: DUF975 family protein [Roseburia sp.]|nr:DUF975 family protein [Roseburia sp.]